MKLPPYKFYLKKNASEYYYIDANGDVQSQTEAQANETNRRLDIEHGIIKWDEIKLSWVRHERYHGIFRKLSTPIQFTEQMAKILRYVYFTQGGVMGSCILRIDLRDKTEIDVYNELFSVAIDFSTFKSTRDFVEVTLMDSDLNAKIQAYENTEFETTVDNLDCARVNMDGINIRTRYDYVIASYSGNVSSGAQGDVIHHNFVRQVGDLSVGSGNSPVNSFGAANFMFTAHSNTEVVINFEFTLHLNNIGSTTNAVKFRLEKWTGQPDVSSRTVNATIYTSPNLTSGNIASHTDDATYTVTMSREETLVMWIDINDITGGSSMDYVIESATMSATCTTLSATGEEKGYRLPQLTHKHLQAMAGTQHQVQSSYMWSTSLSDPNNYDAIPYRTVIVPESALKQIVDTPKIKTTFQQITQHIIACHGGGIGTNGDYLVVEKLPFFYNKTSLIYDFGSDYSELAFEQASNYVINAAEFGWEGYDAVDDINKVNEFNTKHVYKFPITRILDTSNQKWNMVSPYAASMYYIELTRAQNGLNYQNNVRTNNSKRDDSNRNFVVYVEQAQSAGVHNLQRGGTVTGIEYPTQAYNIPLSPKRCLLRSAPLISSILRMCPDKTVTFQTSEQTADLNSQMTGGGLIQEGTDVDFTPSTPLFQPIIIKFKAASPLNLSQLMGSTPYGVMRINYKGANIDGFVLNASINPGKPQPYEFELLSSPNNNLSNLY